MTQQESTIKNGGYHVATQEPLLSIEQITPEGQHPVRRMYRPGYEEFFNLIPKLDMNDEDFNNKFQIAGNIMNRLLTKLQKDEWLKNVDMQGQSFGRTILGLEEPREENGSIISGSEIVVGHWNGYSTPVHGHAAGLSFEGLISGKVRVVNYSKPQANGKVRPIVMTVYDKPGEMVDKFTTDDGLQSNIHAVHPIGLTHTLHFFNEHTRDAKGNTFEEELFEDTQDIIIMAASMTKITVQQSYSLNTGDVVLVRDLLNPDYGDYYSVITNSNQQNLKGVSPKIGNIAMPVSEKMSRAVLDRIASNSSESIFMLKLNDTTAKQFREFYFITPKETTFEDAMNGYSNK